MSDADAGQPQAEMFAEMPKQRPGKLDGAGPVNSVFRIHWRDHRSVARFAMDFNVDEARRLQRMLGEWLDTNPPPF